MKCLIFVVIIFFIGSQENANARKSQIPQLSHRNARSVRSVQNARRTKQIDDYEYVDIIDKDKFVAKPSEQNTNYFPSQQRPKNFNIVESVDHEKAYEAAVAAGDNKVIFNQLSHIPSVYTDLSRRFVPQYSYREKSSSEIRDERAEKSFDDKIKQAVKIMELEKKYQGPVPIKASPEAVAAASKSALRSSPEPQPTVTKEALRNGDFWDSYWVEEGSPNNLRSVAAEPQLESVRVQVMPGSTLYKIISASSKISPKLIYMYNSDV